MDIRGIFAMPQIHVFTFNTLKEMLFAFVRICAGFGHAMAHQFPLKIRRTVPIRFTQHVTSVMNALMFQHIDDDVPLLVLQQIGGQFDGKGPPAFQGKPYEHAFEPSVDENRDVQFKPITGLQKFIRFPPERLLRPRFLFFPFARHAHRPTPSAARTSRSSA